jgi:peptidoglycan LD-endopeptidase LytH
MRRPLALAAAILSLALVLSAPAAGAEDVAAKLKSARERANAAAARLAAAESKLAVAQDKANALKAEAAAAEAQMGQARERIRAMALREYTAGAAPRTVGSDMNAVARGQALRDLSANGTRADLDRFRAARESLQDARSALDAQLASQRKALAGLKDQQARAKAELTRLARIQAELEAKAKAAAAAKARAVSQARASRSAARSGVIASGSWICPVQGPRAFSNDWGQPRSGGRRHQGTDILSPRGTPVVASVSGIVRHHGSSLGGLSYYLNGDDGNTYFGTHLAGYAAQGRVAAGTVVGYVGNSGNARGGPTHLHFEIHPGGGGPVNPYPTLRQHC